MRYQEVSLIGLAALLAATLTLATACEEDYEDDDEDDEQDTTPLTPTEPQVLNNIQYARIGTVSTGAGGVLTLSLDVPPNAASWTLTLRSRDGRISPAVTGLTGPGGQRWVEVGAQGQDIGPARSAKGEDGELTMLYPASPQWPWEAGRHTLEVSAIDANGASASGTFDAYVAFDLSPQLNTATLNVIFWFTRGEYLSAAEARSDQTFQASLDIFRRAFTSVGVTIGDIDYREVPGTQGEALAVVTSTPDKQQLFALAPSDVNALSVFFIDAIQDGDDADGFVTLGEASGIPATPALPGFPTGSVIISGTQFDSARRLGETIAHEAGHALGLSHTSEQDGMEFDPLADTPECPPRFDSDGDQTLTAEECAQAGSDNLMFWTAPDDDTTPQERLTPDQGFVIKRTVTVQ
jgi:hypothetical protein